MSVTAAAGLAAAVISGNALTAKASGTGDGLYGTLTSIYNAAQSTAGTSTTSGSLTSGSLTSGNLTSGSSLLGSITSGSTSNSISSGAGNGNNKTVNGRRVITYYPVYNTLQQQQIGIQQQVQQQIRQYYDVSGNAYYNYVNGGGSSTDVSGNNASGTAFGNTVNQWTQALTPDIAALESDPVGPVVQTTGLSESYHENYKIYEERFNDLYAIYTNIPSGSISNRPAIFDVPNGVSVRMMKDGRQVGFSNKTQIKEEGTYVIQFYVVQDGSEELPAWQQTIERGRFTFRIQYTAGLDGQPLETVSEPSELESFADLVQGDSEVLLPGTAEDAETGTETETETEAETAQPENTVQADAIIASSGLSTEWDENTGYYRMTLLTGDSFNSSIPDGMVTNEAVLFMPSEGIRMELYRGGALVEYEPGNYISEAGSYIMIPVIDNLDYESYYRLNRPMMRFRIVSGAVRDMGIITAPETTKISAVRHGGEDVTDKAMVTDLIASLSSDGAWEVDMDSKAGKQTVYITRDTLAPDVTIKTEPNAAHITYGSDDIANAVLYRGNELINEGQLPTTVTQSGRYRLIVSDVAGNETVRDFNVQYRVNVFAVLAIIAVIALIGALVIFMQRVRTSVRVR